MSKPINITEYQVILNLIVYMVVMIDISIILMKFRENNLIEPKHLSIYPLSKRQKFIFHFFLILTDYKSFVYLAAVLSSASIFIAQSLYVEAILSSFIWFLFLTILVVWVLVIFQIGGQYLIKYSKYAHLFIFFIFISAYLGMSLFDKMELINNIPLLSNVGGAIFGLLIHDLNYFVGNIVFLFGGLFLGILCYRILPSKY